MFNFLKDKLKGVLSKFTKKVEEEAPEEKVEIQKEVAVEPPKIEKPKKEAKAGKPKFEEKEGKKPKVGKEEPKEEVKGEVPKVEVREEVRVEAPKIETVRELKVEEKTEIKDGKKGFFAKIKESFAGREEKAGAGPEVGVEGKVEITGEKKGFFQRITQTITTKRISAEKFDEIFWDLELALLENNVAVEVIEKIKQDLKSQLVDKPIPRGKVEETIANSLHVSIEGLFKVPQIDLLERARQKKPFVICFVGVNGSGKTTSIAKIANYLQSHGFSVVLAAADTFRAAAIDQLQLHADRLNVKLVRHDYGSDPAAVAFDAIKHAEANNKDVVLIDTAGRLHSNINLMDEMRKIMRVAKPDLKIFVGESITGNDCVEQAKQFNEAVGIDGIILAKADVDEKGGAAISVSYVTKKPILFLGVGQEYNDLQEFDKERLLASIGL
ncbi:MAG: signal recognition particle-docking protein FtsY [Candidatus Woesearchaeota archaeon]